jgi:hypothetical protein
MRAFAVDRRRCLLASLRLPTYDAVGCIGPNQAMHNGSAATPCCRQVTRGPRSGEVGRDPHDAATGAVVTAQ